MRNVSDNVGCGLAVDPNQARLLHIPVFPFPYADIRYYVFLRNVQAQGIGEDIGCLAYCSNALYRSGSADTQSCCSLYKLLSAAKDVHKNNIVLGGFTA
jgi:hypothetical protein